MICWCVCLCLAVDFFNQINMLYGTITEFCTEESCPVMSAGRKYEYHWADGTTVKKPIKCSAPKYIDYLMSWVQCQLDDEALFPSRIGLCLVFCLDRKKFYVAFIMKFQICCWGDFSHIMCKLYSYIWFWCIVLLQCKFWSIFSQNMFGQQNTRRNTNLTSVNE